MGRPARAVVCIVTPGTRSANNGNWRTAARWAAMLRDRFEVIVQTAWNGEPADVLVALHAHRSAEAVSRFRSHGRGPVVVVLTGTDVYRDLPHSAAARETLDRANRIVALQSEALRELTPAWQEKAEVIFQSAPAITSGRRPKESVGCAVVGHLRVEKDPATLFEALRRVPETHALRVRHIGAALDEDLGAQARRLEREDARYRYLGALPHGLARIAIARSHLLLHPSIMEGGANVIVEAVQSGTGVIASRIPGNVGMLGPSHPGYFEPGDASGLASLLVQACTRKAFRRALLDSQRQLGKRFAPETESAALRRLAEDVLR